MEAARRLAKRGLAALLVVAVVSGLSPGVSSAVVRVATAIDTTKPAAPVRLVFAHHSTGENWLADGHGGLGTALRDNNYFVSDTNYGWGPSVGGTPIGSSTDIGHWWSWFRGDQSATVQAALFSEGGQNCSYSRLATVPAGANEIVMLKSCFPNSALKGSPSDPVPPIGSNPLRNVDSGSEYHTVANAKGIYIDLLDYFAAHPDKLFVMCVSPPLSDPTYSANARHLADWLVHDWLDGYPDNNVMVFDLYNVLTTNGGSASCDDLGQAGGNHHRVAGGGVEHKTDGDNDASPNVLEYATSPGDDHPSPAGGRKATGEFVPLLNAAYNAWKTGASAPAPMPDEKVGCFTATGLLGAVQLGWTPLEASRTVRVVRAENNYWMDPEAPVAGAPAAVAPACEVATSAVIVYEGSGSSYTDTDVVPGTQYFYTAFLNDPAGGWVYFPACASAYAKEKVQVVRPWLSTSHVRDYVPFYVKGSIPWHPSRTIIRLKFLRYYSGAWRYVRSGSYYVAAGRTSYAIRSVVPKTGSWRVLASHEDFDHVLSASWPRYFRVYR